MATRYVDLYLLPLPKKNRAKYRKLAAAAGAIWMEHGARSYREFEEDDLEAKGMVSFTKIAKLKKGEVLTAAVIGFDSAAHRKKVNKKVMKDPRLEELMTGKPLFEMKRMVYGGFSTIVDA